MSADSECLVGLSTNTGRSRTGLVFFGTPHRGGNNTLVGLGSAAARIARLLGAQSSKDIEKTLQNGSLFSQILRFQWKEQLLNYKIVSFWEGIGDVSNAQ